MTGNLYFVIINAGATLFFLVSLVLCGLVRRWWLIPFNTLGFMTAGAVTYLELTNQGTKAILLYVFPILVATFLANIILIYREALSESEEARSVHADAAFSGEHHYMYWKLILLEERMQAEIDASENLEISDRLQALQLWNMGNDALIKKDLDDAIQKFELSLKWVPTSIAHLNLSHVYLLRNKPEEVAQHSITALELHPDLYEALINNAIALERLGRFKEAFQSVRRANQLEPERAETFLLMGHNLRKSDRINDAHHNYTKVTELDPDNFEAWYFRGICLVEMKDIKEARVCFEKVVKLKSDHFLALFHLGNALTTLGESSAAVPRYRKALAIYPGFYQAWTNQGIVLSKLGKNRAALRSFARALKLQPNYSPALMNQGLAYETLGRYGRALESYKKFLQLASPEMEHYARNITNRIEVLKQRVRKPVIRPRRSKVELEDHA